jgi:hypothetical protein
MVVELFLLQTMYKKDKFLDSIKPFVRKDGITIIKCPNPQFVQAIDLDLRKGKVHGFIKYIAKYYCKLTYDLYKRDAGYSVHIEANFQMI